MQGACLVHQVLGKANQGLPWWLRICLSMQGTWVRFLVWDLQSPGTATRETCVPWRRSSTAKKKKKKKERKRKERQIIWLIEHWLWARCCTVEWKYLGSVNLLQGSSTGCVCVPSSVWLFAIPWAVAHQAAMSMEFSRRKYWSGLPFPSPADLPNPGIQPVSLVSAAFGRQILYC